MRRTHVMPQFPHSKGGAKSTPDAPLDYLPAGGSDGKKSPTPNSEGMKKHPTRQTSGSKALRGGS